ncbi:MAG TPA: hypothetical protein VI937_01275 [Negativicutes bacterium]|nr:hypothetical protein [Negativicutes bacterium]
MTKKLIKARPEEVIGSSFAGYLTVTYQLLVEYLGQPNDRTKEGEWRSGDHKVKAEWAFKTANKKNAPVITIYDYKDPRPIESIDLWHIGSKGKVNIEKFLADRFPKLNIKIDLRKKLIKSS